MASSPFENFHEGPRKPQRGEVLWLPDAPQQTYRIYVLRFRNPPGCSASSLIPLEADFELQSGPI